jgi:hypothetical protein
VLIFLVILSINIPYDKIIAYVDNIEIHYSDEFMSGDADAVPFVVAFIVFLPITIVNIINILKKKKLKTLLIFIVTIFAQIYIFHKWLDHGNILLNLLYGTIILKLWIITFAIIICYVIINVIISIKRWWNVFNT